MGILEKDRKAYEKGKEEAKHLKEHPIDYLFSPNPRPSDPSEAAAYDKGFKGEPLDEDKKK